MREDFFMNHKKNRKTEILELQNMLRVISQVNGSIPLVNPDGIFGPKTEDAVRAFQKTVGLPANGIVDFATWDAIFRSYMHASQQISLRPIQPFPSGNYQIKSGERSDIVLFVQLMLSALAVGLEIFEEIEPSGLYDDKTEEAIGKFQTMYALPSDGIVDYKTWNALAESYANIVGNSLYDE